MVDTIYRDFARRARGARPCSISDEDRAKVLALHREGRSIRDIAVALKTPKSTVARSLKAAAQPAA
jgi:IS30 family transposase